MNVSLEDVIALLKELEDDKKSYALSPQDRPHDQYYLLGMAAGVKASIRKLEIHYEREQ